MLSEFVKDKSRICVIQAENPDGDSLGSAIALDYLLEDHDISLYCPVEIPKYLRYFDDWSRVSQDFDFEADAYIIVDTAAAILLSKLLDDPAIKTALEQKPVLVIDHHSTPDDLPFPHEAVIETLPSCCSLIYKLAKDSDLSINQSAATALVHGILSDTLGLTSVSTTTATFREVADLLDTGIKISELEEHRREFMKKSPRILAYKAELIKHIEYHLNGTFATVHIPWEEIHEYSNEYNPAMLILEELRLTEGVKVAVVVKTYPDGKVTGKIRTAAPVAEEVAGFFGGGGHAYAAGFRTYDTTYEQVVRDLMPVVHNLLESNDEAL